MQIPGVGRVDSPSRRWIPFFGLTPLDLLGGPRSGRPIDREAPMEPPIGYGLTHRSIFPESQFRTAAPCLAGGPVPKPDGSLAPARFTALVEGHTGTFSSAPNRDSGQAPAHCPLQTVGGS